MNNAQINESNINDINKKKKIQKISTFSAFLGFCLLIFIINSFVYISFEFKSADQIKSKVETYINKKYDTDVKLTLNEKNSINKCLFWLDDCWFSGVSINVYEYEYTGIDRENREFVINYTNGYFKNGFYHKSKITENYSYYNEKQNIEQLLKKQYNTFNVYVKLSDQVYINNEMVVLIYALENNINNLVDINNKISSINSMAKIIYTNDIDAYNLILNDNSDLSKKSYSWQSHNLLIQKLEYNEIKFGASEEDFTKLKPSIKLNKNKFIFVIMGHAGRDKRYYIYQK